jgi:hypothetical protein
VRVPPPPSRPSPGGSGSMQQQPVMVAGEHTVIHDLH